MDGPLAPFGDADSLRSLIVRDVAHRGLYQVFLKVRDAVAKILEGTSLADIVDERGSRKGKKSQKKAEAKTVVPMVVQGGKAPYERA